MAENGLLIDTPLLEKLERLAIQWQKSLPGVVGGHNTSRSAGPGQEFLDHRQFHHGDDLRAVNWRAYLRLEKMFLKMFQLEPRIPVRVLVDISRSMVTGGTTGGSKSALSKFDYARKLAAAMCYVALVRLDSIYLQPFAEKLGDPLRLGGGRQRFQPVANYLQALKPGGSTKFFDITRDFISRYPQRGLAIVISDFLDDAGCEKPLQYLTDFGHEAILIHVWADEDREPPWDGELDLEDAESGTRVQLAFDDAARARYVAAFDEFALQLRNVALRNGGRYVGLSTSIPIEEAIFGPMVRAGAVQ
ncbi:MAG: DUF58 domain-containing protein [Acidobacteriota bacterium]|nr:DUF58 domain-containing protein [Acidobacteriota bacterium]